MKDEITKENILLNIKIKIQKSSKTQEDFKDEWKKTANKWKVRLIYFNTEFVTDFYMGPGLVDKMGRPRKPIIKDVLYSMIADDVSNMDFAEFCDTFGYDNDSIKALEIFKACQKQTKAYYNMFDEEERKILQELLQDY
jgi:hypothetical protein